MKSVWVKCAFVILVLWWGYLFFTTQIIVVFDAAGYEGLGQLILHQGWGEYLRTGPQREPLFPGIVALSMRLGDWWGISYFYPLKMIGTLFLFLTMVFSYRLMRMLGVSSWLAGLCAFYLGISPTMTNSSMRLWSEFAVYPWVVLAIIWMIKSWQAIEHAPDDYKAVRKTAGHGLMVGLMFLLIMSGKAIAEGVFLLCLWPYYVLIFFNWRAKNDKGVKHAIVFCAVALCVFEGPVTLYKWENYQHNGQFVFTNRGDYALYGNIQRRMQPLTLRHLGAAIAFVPGLGVCPALYGPDDCSFWSARYSDDIVEQKREELNAKGITGEAASRYFVHNSIQMMLANPLQAVLLMFIEAHEMFFWESSIAFVAYPDWLERIFYSPLFVAITMSIFALLSWAGCVFAFFYLGCRFCKRTLVNREGDWAVFWVLNFIFWYTALYSLFFIVDRYSFPLISLYVALIAFLFYKSTKVFVK